MTKMEKRRAQFYSLSRMPLASLFNPQKKGVHMDLSVKTLKLAHKASSNHRALLNQSELCGCFYCEATFSPEEIREYTDRGQTALCPRCSIDSVIPAAAGYALTAQFLSAMEKYWFAAA